MSEFYIVGAGFFGATVAERLANFGISVAIIEKRAHIGGNSYSEIDKDSGIEYHKYGSHIFHTSNERVWEYVNRFTKFNQYRHTVWTTFKNKAYTMPISLSTINAYYDLNLKPHEVAGFLSKERAKESYDNPKNLEEKAISLVGRPLYEAFIRGYTIKQWEKDPKELSADIITRLPVRHNYVNRYFKDKYEGIPLDGYGSVFKNILNHPKIAVRLNSDYFCLRDEIGDAPTLYTGPIDRFFDFKHGNLDWRTIDFKKEIYDVEDFQGCSVMNYADETIKHTRIHEFKHFHPERNSVDHTLTFKEYSRVAGKVDEPYYPVNTPRNSNLLRLYQQDIKKAKNVIFGGRLGSYRYFDMEATIAHALELSDKIIARHK